MDLGIEGRVALVMGASKGIGRGAAALAREGARVAIASRSRERIEAAAHELSSDIAESGRTPDVRGFVADASDPDKLPALVGEVQESLGPIEILVTNTGGPPMGEALGFDRDAWEAAYRALVLALALIEAVVPGMRERGWGRIVKHHLVGDARADRGPRAVEQPPPRGGRSIPRRSRTSRPRRHPGEQRCPRPDRNRPDR